MVTPVHNKLLAAVLSFTFEAVFEVFEDAEIGERTDQDKGR